MDAEDGVTRHHQPVEQRRLVEIRLSVQDRHDQAVLGEHLAGDFRVAGLVRFEQRTMKAREAEQPGRQHEDAEQRDRDAALG
jgi:hypothetical protein